MTKELNVARRLGPLQFVVIRDFIEARIAEDEALAAAAADARGVHDGVPVGPAWTAEVVIHEQTGERVGDTAMVTGQLGQYGSTIDLWDDEGAMSLQMHVDAAEHVAAWDPARVLRECEAKRRLLDFTRVDTDSPFEQWFMVGFVMWWLARIWADHPDFDPSWQPTFGP